MKLVKPLSIFGALLSWEVIARLNIFHPLLFPTISSVLLWALENFRPLFFATYQTLQLLITGLSISGCLSIVLMGLSFLSHTFDESLEGFVSLLQPLPSISLLPFAILWFGLGKNPIIFITVFGSIWPFLINFRNGFRTINPIILDVGRNYGLKGVRLIRFIMLPAALPNILTGLRVAWGIGWRSVVAAELVFGSVGTAGGLGWLIYVNRFLLNTPGMLAGIMSISIIGILVEHVIFKLIEKHTIKKWGMMR